MTLHGGREKLTKPSKCITTPKLSLSPCTMAQNSSSVIFFLYLLKNKN